MYRFTDWKEARDFAEKRANEFRLDCAIRATKEYGRLGYTVSFASKNDSDYARAEIVRPSN